MSATGATPQRNLRSLATRLLVVAGAIAAGLVLQRMLGARLDEIRARAELAHVLRTVGIPIFAGSALVGATLAVASRRAITAERFPPPGALSWGSAHVITGPPARRLARICLVLAVLVIVCSIAGGALLWEMARQLLLCRAT